jgi:glycosyltransferase involved in cell wall biosynthesis
MLKEISIIIPAYNEEDHIKQCLDAIFNQYLQYINEVIIADNNSQDKTVPISKQFNVRVISGGYPALARNKGAKIAKGKYLLFVDADTFLPENFLEEAIETFKKKKLKVASFYIKPYPADIFNSILFKFYNTLSFILAKYSFPTIATAGCCILVEKKIHDDINGFRENMVVLEEYDYIRRIKKYGRFNVLPIHVATSTRRFLPGRRLKQTFILIIYYIKWLITGDIDNDKLGYWK